MEHRNSGDRCAASRQAELLEIRGLGSVVKETSPVKRWEERSAVLGAYIGTY
jgi:hypothetical protein